MKKFLLISAALLLAVSAQAQVIFFAPTCGDGKLNGYGSIKIRPGENNFTNYTMFQYGVGKEFAFGADYYWSQADGVINIADFGVIARYGHTFSQWFKAGIMLTPKFRLMDNFKFSNVNVALYLQGDLTRDGKLFWLSNSFVDYYPDQRPDYYNYWYLGYHFTINENNGITPMVGLLHSWNGKDPISGKFDPDLNLAIGFYYSYRKVNFYIWTDRYFDDHFRMNLGMEFLF